jgi:hypothetical protein
LQGQQLSPIAQPQPFAPPAAVTLTPRYGSSLEREVDALRRRDAAQQSVIERLDAELRLAASLQRSLHSPPPAVDGVDFHTLYRPAYMVSGDTYELARLDDSHVAVSLADATGHGVSAGLLSVYVNRSLRGAETHGGRHRLLSPDEVLTRANSDLLDAELQDCQFVAGLYAVYCEPTRVIRWARAGSPYPILIRHGEAPRQLSSNGPLLGVLPGARFEVCELQLNPGDSLLFHTDGLDALLLDGHRNLHCCDLDRTDWFRGLRDVPIEDHLKRLQGELDGPEASGPDRDDVTVVCLHVRERTSINGRRGTVQPSSATACLTT